MAENNATSAKPSGTTPKDSNLIPQHKRLAQGAHPDTGCYDKTPRTRA